MQLIFLLPLFVLVVVGLAKVQTDTGGCVKTGSGGCVKVCTPCDLSQCPYTSSSDGPSKLRIKSYQDGDVPGCPGSGDQDCQSDTNAAWPGEFDIRDPNSNGSYCRWSTGQRGTDHTYSIDGVKLSVADLSLNTTGEEWFLEIRCINNFGTETILWQGTKDCADDGSESPVGVYTLDSSCASNPPSTLEVESY